MCSIDDDEFDVQTFVDGDLKKTESLSENDQLNESDGYLEMSSINKNNIDQIKDAVDDQELDKYAKSHYKWYCNLCISTKKCFNDELKDVSVSFYKLSEVYRENVVSSMLFGPNSPNIHHNELNYMNKAYNSNKLTKSGKPHSTQ